MPRIIIFDLETQDLIPSGGSIEGLRIASGAFYDSTDDQIHMFSERTISDKFFPVLRDADLVVSHNGIQFDYKILKKYLPEDIKLDDLPTWDTVQWTRACKKEHNASASLPHLSANTLGYGKTGDGINAPELYRKKKWKELEAYTRQDVKLTKEIFYHGLERGFLLTEDRKDSQRKLRINTERWKNEIEKITRKTPFIAGDWALVETDDFSAKKDHQWMTLGVGLKAYNLDGIPLQEIYDVKFEPDAEDAMYNYPPYRDSEDKDLLFRIKEIEDDIDEMDPELLKEYDNNPPDYYRYTFVTDKAILLPYTIIRADQPPSKNRSRIESVYGNLYISKDEYIENDLEGILPFITEATGRPFYLKDYRSNVAVRRDLNDQNGSLSLDDLNPSRPRRSSFVID